MHVGIYELLYLFIYLFPFGGSHNIFSTRCSYTIFMATIYLTLQYIMFVLLSQFCCSLTALTVHSLFIAVYLLF